MKFKNLFNVRSNSRSNRAASPHLYLPTYPLSHSHKRLVERSLLSSLRDATQTFDNEVDRVMAVLSTTVSRDVQRNRINDVMATGAGTFLEMGGLECVHWYLECDGESVYLCRSSFRAVSPLESWLTERVLVLGSSVLVDYLLLVNRGEGNINKHWCLACEILRQVLQLSECADFSKRSSRGQGLKIYYEGLCFVVHKSDQVYMVYSVSGSVALLQAV